jgi:hypothetical protein
VEETTVSRSPETLNLLNPSPPTNRKTTVKSSRERKRERERERERVEFTRIWRRRRRRREQERMGYARTLGCELVIAKKRRKARVATSEPNFLFSNFFRVLPIECSRIRWHLVARVAGGLPHVACAL